MKSALAREIVKVIGDEAAKELLLAKGGRRILIPSKLRPSHWLVNLLGQENAEKMCKHFTSNRFSIEISLPLWDAQGRKARNERLRQLYADGKSSDEIARALKITRRSVLRIRANMKRESQL